MAPRPVQVHDSPIAMLRFFLKYVFKANEHADIETLLPIAVK